MFGKIKSVKKALEPFNKVDKLQKSREEKLDDYFIVLTSSNLNSKDAFSYHKYLKLFEVFRIVFIVLLMVSALAVILLPVPQYIEIETIYYFSPDRGITVSDVIALFVIFFGVFLLYKPKK